MKTMLGCMLCLFCLLSSVAMGGLVGGGDFSEPYFTSFSSSNANSQDIPGVGLWKFTVNVAGHAAYSVSGTGDARCLNLQTLWQGGSCRGVYDPYTPWKMTQDWTISADLAETGSNTNCFIGLGTGQDGLTGWFGGDVLTIDIDNVTAAWSIVNGASGTTTLSVGVISDYQKLVIAYDATTGTVSASLGGEAIFSNQAVSASQIGRLQFMRTAKPNTSNWLNGTFKVDNVSKNPDPVSTPTFSVNGGRLSNSTSVEITCVTLGASIHYTTNGTTPTAASPVYSTPVEVNQSMTLKAMAVAPGYVDSSVTTARYAIIPTGENFGHWWERNHPFQICAINEQGSNIQQYIDIGFSSYMGTNLGTINPDTMFGAASQAGLGWHWFYRWNSELAESLFIPTLADFVEQYPGCLGVNVGDENDPTYYPQLAPLVTQVKGVVPDAIVYHVLRAYSDNDTFKTNLNSAINTLAVDMIMFDQYPFNNGSTASDFYDNLAIVRERALAAGIPYWNWLQGHGWYAPPTYSLRQDPSESEVRLQAFMSLAYGYTGLAYWTYAGTYSPYTNAILNSSGTLSSIGEAVEGAIDEIKNIGNVTKDLTSTGIFYVTASGESQPTGTTAWAQQSGYPISSVTVNSGSKGFVIGLFEGDDAKKYFMIVNGNHAAYTSAADTAATVTITFDSSVNEITLINRTTGVPETVTLTNHALTNYSLPGGTGDLFCLPSSSAAPMPGDANRDNKVDVGDLGILAANYGRNLQSEGVASNLWWSLGDFNEDGKVDVGDLGILAANYGSSGSSFDADYAKVFGTTTDDSSTEDTTSSLCSSLGLSLIAGLALMCLMLMKLEE